MKHRVAWQAPSPLWSRILEATASAPVDFRQPAVLRFDGDEFMDDLAAILAGEPEELASYLARPESWRSPAVGWPEDGTAEDGPEDGSSALKLYQAAHGRYYLIAASLVCRLAGLPDRKVDAAAEERASFVVRRLEPRDSQAAVDPADPATYREAGWFGDRTAGTWTALGDAGSLDPREELLPLFPTVFGEPGSRRRLHAGLIPTGTAETYAGGAVALIGGGELAADPLGDPRMGEWLAGVLPGLDQLANLADSVSDAEAREALHFALVDFAAFLENNHPSLWQAVEAGSGAELSRAAAAVFPPLEASLAGVSTWHQLLVVAAASGLLAGGDTSALETATAQLTRPDIQQAAADLLAATGTPFSDLMAAAFAELPPSSEPAPAPAPASGDALYVARCVYQRPRCGMHAEPLVSRPSTAFRLASFFDPDAPTRPLRISMPVDTSQKGLRRFPKGVSFLLSNQLRQQMERVAGAKIGDLEDGNAGDDGGLPDLGVICTLSIPIITICALIFLMILVNLLNIVFWWKPLFKICFPLKLGAK